MNQRSIPPIPKPPPLPGGRESTRKNSARKIAQQGTSGTSVGIWIGLGVLISLSISIVAIAGVLLFRSSTHVNTSSHSIVAVATEDVDPVDGSVSVDPVVQQPALTAQSDDAPALDESTVADNAQPEQPSAPATATTDEAMQQDAEVAFAAEPDVAEPAAAEVQPAVSNASAIAWLESLHERTLNLPSTSASLLAGRIVTLAEPPASLRDAKSDSTRVPTLLQMKLLGIEVVFGREDSIVVDELQTQKVLDSASPPFLQPTTWVVTHVDGGQKTELCRIGIRDCCLTFKWTDDVDKRNAAELLRYCLLELRVAGPGNRQPRALCKLSSTAQTDSIAVNLLDIDARLELTAFSAPLLPKAENLRAAITFHNYPKHDVESEGPLTVDSPMIARFMGEHQMLDDDPGIEVNASFACNEHPVVTFTVTAYPNRLEEDIDDDLPVQFNAKELIDFRKMHRSNKLQLARRKKAILQNGVSINASDLLDEVQDNLDQNELALKWREQVVNTLAVRDPDRKIRIELWIEIADQKIVIVSNQPTH